MEKYNKIIAKCRAGGRMDKNVEKEENTG